MNRLQKVSARLRNTKEYNLWIQKIRERDGLVCSDCKVMGVPGAIQIHHIVSFQSILENNNIETVEQGLKCEQFWDVSNGKSLCCGCHYQTHNRENIGNRIYRKK